MVRNTTLLLGWGGRVQVVTEFCSLEKSVSEAVVTLYHLLAGAGECEQSRHHLAAILKMSHT